VGGGGGGSGLTQDKNVKIPAASLRPSAARRWRQRQSPKWGAVGVLLEQEIVSRHGVGIRAARLAAGGRRPKKATRRDAR